MRPCLYCGDQDRPKTAEHVLQKALGGSMTLTEDVCEHCNSIVFAPLDDELSRFVRPFLKRTTKVQRSLLREGLTLTYDEDKRVWTVIRIDGEWKPIIYPQIAFTTPTTVKLAFDNQNGLDYRETLSKMIEELREPTTLSIDEQVSPLGTDEAPIHPILVRTARKSYVIIAGCTDDISALRKRIELGKIGAGISELPGQPPRSEKIDQPYVSGIIRRDFAKIERAVAKTAINYVCKVFGPDVARRSELEALRSYALVGGESNNSVRLVYEQAEIQEFDELFGTVCTVDEHALMLLFLNGSAAVLQFLEGRIFHVVLLGVIPGISSGSMVVTTFNPQTRTHQTSAWRPSWHSGSALRVTAIS